MVVKGDIVLLDKELAENNRVLVMAVVDTQLLDPKYALGRSHKIPVVWVDEVLTVVKHPDVIFVYDTERNLVHSWGFLSITLATQLIPKSLIGVMFKANKVEEVFLKVLVKSLVDAHPKIK